jgi:hypothetical protein
MIFLVPVGVVAYQLWKKKQSQGEDDEKGGGSNGTDKPDTVDDPTVSTTESSAHTGDGDEEFLQEDGAYGETQCSVMIDAICPDDGPRGNKESLPAGADTLPQDDLAEKRIETLCSDDPSGKLEVSTVSISSNSLHESYFAQLPTTTISEQTSRHEEPIGAAALHQWWKGLQEERQRKENEANMNYLNQLASSQGMIL